MLRRCHEGRVAERGSVAFSMLVLMVVALLGIAMVARSQNELKTTVARTSGGRAVQAADLGVAASLARLETGESGPFDGSMDTDGGRVTYRVDPEGAGRYRVTATAVVDGRERVVVATVSGSPLHPEVLYLTGPSLLDGASISIEGDIGTGGALTIVGSPQRDGLQRLYGPDASCVGCSSPLVVETERKPVSFDDTGRSQTCPAGGRFPPVVDGMSGAPFDCSGPEIVLEGTILAVNGPVVIRVADGTAVRFDDADVNPGGALDDLRIEVAGDRGSIALETSSVRGLVSAPDRRVTPADSRLTGVLVAREVMVATGRSFRIDGAEEAAGLAFRGWHVVTWRTDS